MESHCWQLKSPLDAIIFDCDGTLSKIEGIDVLAAENQQGDYVKQLTADAMSKTGINPTLYRERLEIVKPTREQVMNLGQQYYANKVDDVECVIRLFLKLKKEVFVVSAGLKLAVAHFAKQLGVSEQHVFAVDLTFDAQNNYHDFEHNSPLLLNDGKKIIVTDIQHQHPRVAYVGDGLNDLVVRNQVARFIGYGGAYFRENIAAASDVYITASSLILLLPLCLTAHEVAALEAEDQVLYQKGLKMLENSCIFNSRNTL